MLNKNRMGREQDLVAALTSLLERARRPGVVNLSLRGRGEGDGPVVRLLRKLVAAGFVVVVGAGNEGALAMLLCLPAPWRPPGVVHRS